MTGAGMEKLASRLKPVPEGRCLLGISGGADSCGLLHLLLPLRDAGKIQLEAAHVNHGLRGAESDGDEAFVRALCAEKGVPLHVIRADLEGRRDENTAREKRYEAFEEILQEREIRTLILAHQRDDQAETFLLHLLRGAGPDGLAGMKPLEKRTFYSILRPMLDISGTEIRQEMAEAGISWREDGTNGTPDYLRNRLRMELLPLMEELTPGAGRHIARAAALIGKDGEALNREAARIFSAHSGEGWLETDALQDLPEAVRMRVLRLWWKKNGPVLAERSLSYDQTRRLDSLLDAKNGTIVNLPAEWRAKKERSRLRLLPPEDRKKGNEEIDD